MFHFTDSELERRRLDTLALAAAHDCDAVLCFGENRSGVAVTYLTEWPVTRSALYALTASEHHLWVAFHNHVPAASRRARVDSVRDAYGDYLDDVFAVVGSAHRIATVGPIPPAVAALAQQNQSTLVAIDGPHARMRQLKSQEEIRALELGAEVSDAAALALIDACAPGVSDWQLLAAAKKAYTERGGLDHICYIAVTDMTQPDRDVPSQFPEGRIIGPTSMVTFELSASIVPEYPGQILRTVVLTEPVDEVLTLSTVAEQCKATLKAAMRPGVNTQELIALSGMIEQAGLTTNDDLFHGFGMGYLEPIATSASRRPNHSPDLVLTEGMAIVVQPNVTNAEHSLGVQTGELVVIEQAGARDLHDLPTGLIRAES